jgi:hypothetical protein
MPICGFYTFIVPVYLRHSTVTDARTYNVGGLCINKKHFMLEESSVAGQDPALIDDRRRPRLRTCDSLKQICAYSIMTLFGETLHLH